MNINPINQSSGASLYYDFPTVHSFSGLRLIVPPTQEPVSLDLANRHCRIDGNDEDDLILSYIAAARQHCEDRTRRGLLPQTWRLSLQRWPRLPRIQLPIGPLLSVQAVRYTNSIVTTTVMNVGVDYAVDPEPDQGEVLLPYGANWPTAVLNTGSPIQIEFRIGYLAFTSQIQVSGNVAAWVSGDLFDVALVGNLVVVNGQAVTVTAVGSPTSLTLSFAPSVTTQSGGLPNAQLTINQLPAPFTQAILMLVSHFYENREAVVVGHTSTISTDLKMAVDSMLRPYTIYRF